MKTLEEVTSLSRGDKDLLAKVKEITQGLLPGAEILLYGSVASGISDAESDYDLLVLTDKPLSREEERRVDDAIFELEAT